MNVAAQRVHLTAAEVRASWCAARSRGAIGAGIPERGTAMSRTRIAVIAVAAVAALAVALAVAGCGGSSNETTSTSASVTWANGVCGAITTWKQDVASIGADLKTNHTKSDLQAAADKAKGATERLASQLKTLGRPETQAGQEAQSAVSKLATSLRADVESIQTAVEGSSGVTGTLTALSAATGTLATMGTEVSSTVDQLKQIDAKGELSKAFSTADACAALTES